ncbi:NAD-dependent epimerase/dehydratase family protein [Candidatus Magnetominusculus xianensis]|uniref:UDP-glucose 4-epimerase n=1 Tax=Candidatus Magnetominusculus xianensis TaxID=1748249 RepID=A0ABR5SBP8_9BACT|nr:NAD-dependent epimerase/dehydratase family protein [Candidatus Magnetominusculus xianensis]KWT78207.1 UDP-glucose 4-epimerase [Candidatus Magnetominusculus xianensis]MBF0402841.1 GDP-mannose 4,6-dehydratase [Nitrospirota bacterium]
MKILVTGGAGFIGSNVVDGFISAGHDVVIVDNLFTGKLENINTKAKLYVMDVRSDELHKVFEIERPDVVDHHAAQMSVPASVNDPHFDAQVNVLGAVNILQCAVKYGTKKILFASTGGAIYGEADVIPTPETYLGNPLSPYAITKRTTELYLHFYASHYGLKYTVLRYANVYGPRQVPHAEAGVVSIFMEKIISGGIPTVYHYDESPEGMTRDYCCVKDIVRANIMALTAGDFEIINISSGIETSTMHLYRTVLESLRERGTAKDPKFDTPHKGPARAGDIRRSCLDNSKAAKSLNWQPEYDLKKGIAVTVDRFNFGLHKIT